MPNPRAIKNPTQYVPFVAGGMRPHEETIIMPAILVHAFVEGNLEEVLKQIEEEEKKCQASPRLST